MDNVRNRSHGHRGGKRWGAMGYAARAWARRVLGVTVGLPAVISAQQPATATPLVFDGVTVIDVERGTRLSTQRVVVAGNRIQAMGDSRSVALPAGARVVDARSKYLIPGLWDMHTHSFEGTDYFYPLFLAYGVTGIRDASSAVSLDSLVQWRREVLSGARVGPPRQILSGRAVGTQKGCKNSRSSLGRHHICVASTDSAGARRLVDSLKAAGADMIKTYIMPKEMYFVVAAEARRLGISWGGHIGHTFPIEQPTSIEASDHGAAILDHMYWAGDLQDRCWTRWWVSDPEASIERCQAVAERFRRNGTWWVPAIVADRRSIMTRGDTLVQGHYGPLLRRVSEQTMAFWSGSVDSRFSDSKSSPDQARTPPPDSLDHRHMLRFAQAVDLPILTGSDVSPQQARQQILPGLSLHTELALFVAAGLTPLNALRAATLNPARMLHATDSLGTVAAGKLADLVLLDADPLADIANTTAIRAVVANGRYFDRAALDGLLTEVKAKGP